MGCYIHVVYMYMLRNDAMRFTHSTWHAWYKVHWSHKQNFVRVNFIVSTLLYRPIVPFFQVDVRKQVFTGNVLSCLIYAVSAWYHFALVKDNKRIVRVFLRHCSKIFNVDFTLLMTTVNTAAKNEFIGSFNCIQRNTSRSLQRTCCNSLITDIMRYNLRNKPITTKFKTNLYEFYLSGCSLLSELYFG